MQTRLDLEGLETCEHDRPRVVCGECLDGVGTMSRQGQVELAAMAMEPRISDLLLLVAEEHQERVWSASQIAFDLASAAVDALTRGTLPEDVEE